MTSCSSKYMLDWNIVHYDPVCSLIHYIWNSFSSAVQLVHTIEVNVEFISIYCSKYLRNDCCIWLYYSRVIVNVERADELKQVKCVELIHWEWFNWVMCFVQCYDSVICCLSDVQCSVHSLLFCAAGSLEICWCFWVSLYLEDWTQFWWALIRSTDSVLY